MYYGLHSMVSQNSHSRASITALSYLYRHRLQIDLYIKKITRLPLVDKVSTGPKDFKAAFCNLGKVEPIVVQNVP